MKKWLIVWSHTRYYREAQRAGVDVWHGLWKQRRDAIRRNAVVQDEVNHIEPTKKEMQDGPTDAVPHPVGKRRRDDGTQATAAARC